MKRYYLIAVSFILLLIAGYFIYVKICHEEYGHSYSEEQRKLWNEKRVLYPGWLLLDCATVYKSDIWAKSAKIDQEQKDTLWKAIKNKEEELDKCLIENRDTEKKDWDASFPPGKISPSVPLEGLPFTELFSRAESGDPDACLILCQSISPLTGMLGKSWNEKKQLNYLLDKAIAAKRPGALFLKNCMAPLYREQLALFKKKGKFVAIPNPNIKQIQGYEEFKKTLEKGDIFPFLVLDGFLATTEDYLEKEILYQTLLKKADAGDNQAKKQAAQVFFNVRLRFMYYTDMNICNERDANLEYYTKWMPENLRTYTQKIFYRKNHFSPNYSPTWKKYKKISDYCRELAEQGDLTGMYLWLRFGITTLDHFSRQDWENIFKYSRQLMESGYNTYTFDMKYILKEKYSLYHCILKSYYTPSSLDKMHAACSSFSEKFHIEPKNNFFDGSYDNIEELISMSEQGNPMAYFILADCYAKGKNIAKNPGKANELLQKSLWASVDYPLWTIKYSHENIQYPFTLYQRAVKLSLIFLAADNPSYPGRNEKQIYKICKSLQKIQMKYNAMGPFCLALGQIYELGIGVTPDPQKALKFYRRCSGQIRGIRKNPACEREWKRLSEQLEKQKNAS